MTTELNSLLLAVHTAEKVGTALPDISALTTIWAAHDFLIFFFLHPNMSNCLFIKVVAEMAGLSLIHI